MDTKYDGVVNFDGMRTVSKDGKDVDGKKTKVEVVLGRSGEIRILDTKAKTIITTYNIPYGAELKVEEGQKVKKGDILCNWDPFNTLIISDIDGKVEYENIVEGVNMREEGDDQTGIYESVITDCPAQSNVPVFRVLVKLPHLYIFHLPVKSLLVANNGQTV